MPSLINPHHAATPTAHPAFGLQLRIAVLVIPLILGHKPQTKARYAVRRIFLVSSTEGPQLSQARNLQLHGLYKSQYYLSRALLFRGKIKLSLCLQPQSGCRSGSEEPKRAKYFYQGPSHWQPKQLIMGVLLPFKPEMTEKRPFQCHSHYFYTKNDRNQPQAVLSFLLQVATIQFSFSYQSSSQQSTVYWFLDWWRPDCEDSGIQS